MTINQHAHSPKEFVAKATSSVESTVRLSKWLATTGRFPADYLTDGKRAIEQIQGTIECLILIAKINQIHLDDPREWNYPIEDARSALLYKARTFNCLGPLLWACNRVLEGHGSA